MLAAVNLLLAVALTLRALPKESADSTIPTTMWAHASADTSRHPAWTTKRMPHAGPVGGVLSPTARGFLNAALFVGAAATSAPFTMPAFNAGVVPGVGPSGSGFGGAAWWSVPPPQAVPPRAVPCRAVPCGAVPWPHARSHAHQLYPP